MGAYTRALAMVGEAGRDSELASAIPMAAALVVAADAFGHSLLGPEAALEERLGRFGEAARLALAEVRTQQRRRLA